MSHQLSAVKSLMRVIGVKNLRNLWAIRIAAIVLGLRRAEAPPPSALNSPNESKARCLLSEIGSPYSPR